MEWKSFKLGRGLPEAVHATAAAKTWAGLSCDLVEFWVTTAARVIKVRDHFGATFDTLVISTRLDSGTVRAYLGEAAQGGLILTLLRCPIVERACSELPDPEVDDAAFDRGAQKLETEFRKALRIAGAKP